MMVDHEFERLANPRKARACGRCGRVPEVHPAPPGRERDKRSEREIGLLAVRAAELPDVVAESLWRYADSRCLPGRIREGLDWKDEARQELGDAFNYFVWDAQEQRALADAGDDGALEEYGRSLFALSALMVVWQRLHTR